MIRAIDLFCGAGGSSWGARAAGARIVAGFDMWDRALSNYQENFPEARSYTRRLETIDVAQIGEALGKIDLILASPECTSHTHARGGREPLEDSRLTAFQVLRFVRALKPRWVVIENVVNMKGWARYSEFLGRLGDLDYGVRVQTLDAADFGVPQSRRRLFIMCDLKREPPCVAPIRTGDPAPARSVINLDGIYPFSPLRKLGRARATLARAQRAMQELGPDRPFLLVYYSTDRAGGWQRMDVPLRTVTTLDRFALVKKIQGEHMMRMLQPEELKRAMGFPAGFTLPYGTRRERVHMLGNAVCPPVIRAVVRSLTQA